MNKVLWIVQKLYGLLLRLFPRSFRRDFEEEMGTVFRIASEEMTQLGIPALLWYVIRELRDGSALMISEYWAGAQALTRGNPPRVLSVSPWMQANLQENRTMSDSVRFGEKFQKDRRLAITTALPPLVFGIGVAADSAIRGGPWNTIPTWRLYLSIAVGLIPMTIIAIVGLRNLAKGMPDWSLTWIGSGFMGFVLLLKTISEELADEGRFIFSPAADFLMMALVLLAGFGILSYAGSRGWRRAGLFSIGMAAAFCLSLCLSVTAAPFYRHDLALLAGPIGLLLAVLTYGYVIGSDRMRATAFLGVAILILSPLLIANQVWQDWLIGESKPSPAIPLLVLMMVILLSGPAMGLILDPLRRIIERSKV